MKKKYGLLAALMAAIICLGGCGILKAGTSEEASVSTDVTQNTDGLQSPAAGTGSGAGDSGSSAADKPAETAGLRLDENLSGMEIHFIDVGQGDATLIKSGDKAMLIDAGTEDKGTAIQNYLTKQGVTSLDYLVLTHPDSDHIGGAPVIITKFEIGNVLMSGFEKDNHTYQKLIQALDDKRLKWIEPRQGDVFTLGEGSFVITGPSESYEDPNNSSLSLLLSYGNTKALFTGDAEEEAETALLDAGIDLSADLYKAGHHGSKSSTSEAFLKAVNPVAAVISCEAGNSYGHPHAQTLNRLRERGISVYRTDEQGSIAAYLDGSDIQWNTAPSDTWKSGEPQAGGNPPDSTQQGLPGARQQNPAQGQSQAEEQSQVQGQSPSQAQSQVQEQSPAETQGSGKSQVSYICNSNTMKFHFPDCSSVADMSPENKVESTESRDTILASGYVPCKRCNP